MSVKSQKGMLFNRSKRKINDKLFLETQNENNIIKKDIYQKKENDSSKCKTHRPYIPTFNKVRNKIDKSIQNGNRKNDNIKNDKIFVNRRYKFINQSQDTERERDKIQKIKISDLNSTYDALKKYIQNSTNQKNKYETIEYPNVNKSSNANDNIDINYYGNAYKRRLKYWSSKSSSRDNKSNESNERNKISTYTRIKNLKEDLKSNINDAKNIICKLDLCFISKKYIKLKLFPINDVCFISKNIVKPLVLPNLDLCFISKFCIISKILPINDNLFISKKIIKVKQMPLLNNHFISKKIILSTFNISNYNKKRNLSEDKNRKHNILEVINKKLPINNISFISKKIYIPNQIPILPFSFISKNIIKCLKIPKLHLSFISKIYKEEIIYKIPEKNLSFITKERIRFIQKPISNNCYVSKKLIQVFDKSILNSSNITKDLIDTIKKPKIENCYFSKYQIQIYKKPLLNNEFLSKDYIYQTKIIPLIKQCFISKKFKISGYKKPIIKESFITKIINKNNISIKRPLINNCEITKKIIKNKKRHSSNFSSLSLNENLILEEEKITNYSIKDNNIINTPIKINNEDFELKSSNYKDKITTSINSQISKNSDKNIFNFGSIENDILTDFAEIEKKSYKKHPKLETNLRQRRKIEKEIEIQFDDFGRIKEIDNSNIKNKNDDSLEKKSNNSKNLNDIISNNSSQKNLFSLNKSNNNSNKVSTYKKEKMSKSQQLNSKNDSNQKSIIPNLSLKIPNFKFDKNMLIDLKNELNRRKKEKKIIKDFQYSNIRKATQKLNEVLLGKSCDKKNNNIGINKINVKKIKKKKNSGQISVRQNNRYLHILEQEDKINKLNNIEKILDNKLDLSQNDNILFTGIKAKTPVKPIIKKIYKNSDKIKRQKKGKKIPIPNYINLNYILSLQNYPHSLDTYLLNNKVIEHCNNLNNPTFIYSINTLNNQIKSFEKNKIQNPKIDNLKNKINNKEKDNNLYEGLIKSNDNFNISQWSRKDMSKENELAENYIKELNLQMQKNSIKHDITSILNTLTVDNFNDVKDKLFIILNNNNDNQDKLIEVILEKCIIENGYIILYAKLCKELIKILNDKNYLKNKLIEVCKNSFDKAENEFNSNINLNEDQYYHQKKKILGYINLIADLIEVRILNQDIGFYYINKLYDKYTQLNNLNEENIKFINLEAIITFLSKFGKIIIKRNKNENINKLNNFISEKILIIKDNEKIPNYLKYKIINLLEKQNNNWKDTLFEKSIIPKGKEKIIKNINEDDYDYNNNNNNKKINFDDEDKIKDDLTNWIKFLNENDIITPSKLEEEILNEYEWENIDKLISDNKVELVEIIRCFIEVSIDLINKKEDVFKANQYINSVIEFYSKYLSKEEINDFNKKLILIFLEVNNLVVDNIFMFEILGNLLFISVLNKLFNLNDLNVFINCDELTIKNICNVIKFSIQVSGKNKNKFINELKLIKLFSNDKEKKILNSIINNNVI